MMHFFRRSKIHLDCFIDKIDIISAAPITNAMEVIPDWWKMLPKYQYLWGRFYPSPTMKTCRGMYDLYAKSISIPLWSDLMVNVKDDGFYEWKFSDGETNAIIHTNDQYAGFNIGNVGHLKIESPWLLKETTGVDWLFTNPLYSMESVSNYLTLPGIVEYKHQHGSNIQLFINLEKQKTFQIRFGTPLAFLTPLSDKKVVVHRHLVTKNEYNRLADRASSLSFINKYKRHVAADIKNCPFKNHTGDVL